MRDLQPDPLAADIGPVLAPIELERFAGLEHQRHIAAAPCRLFRSMPILTPSPGKNRHTLIRPVATQLHQICAHLRRGTPLFARLARLDQKPRGQPIRIWVQLARPFWRLELRLYNTFAQILLDGVPR